MSAGLLESARIALADLISLGQTRFELFSVELREELARIATLLIGALAALVLGLLGIAFAAFALMLGACAIAVTAAISLKVAIFLPPHLSFH